MSLPAYLRAFWQGDVSGPAAALGWTGIVLLGIALAGVIVIALCALARYLERFQLVDEEPEPERDPRARFETLIAVLGCCIAPAVIAFTR